MAQITKATSAACGRKWAEKLENTISIGLHGVDLLLVLEIIGDQLLAKL